MTREQIERASVTMKESQNYHMSFEDAQDYISKCGFDIPWNDGDVFVDEREITRTVGNVLKWRINSVWHDAIDKPERNRDFLYESARGWFGINNTTKMAREVYPEKWDRFVEGYDVIRWVYIDDLLPERKEETNGGR